MEWRQRLKNSVAAPRADAAAWALINVLPAHPMITAPVAASATGRSKAAIYEAIEQLQTVEVLLPLSESRRNRSWEVAGLLNLISGMDSGQLPASVAG